MCELLIPALVGVGALSLLSGGGNQANCGYVPYTYVNCGQSACVSAPAAPSPCSAGFAYGAHPSAYSYAQSFSYMQSMAGPYGAYSAGYVRGPAVRRALAPPPASAAAPAAVPAPAEAAAPSATPAAAEASVTTDDATATVTIQP